MLMTALRLVFGRRRYQVGAALTATAASALYIVADQTVTIYPDGVLFVDPDPSRWAVIVALALLMGTVFPMHVYAVRQAAWRPRQGGASILGVLSGIGALSCCSPLILPAALSLAGVSGTTLLSMNMTFFHYFGALAALSLLFLLVALVLTARDVTRVCRLGARGHTAPWTAAPPVEGGKGKEARMDLTEP